MSYKTSDTSSFPDGYYTYLTPQEVADRLAVSRSWVYSRMDSGLLPSVDLDGTRRMRESDLRKFMEGLN